MTIQPDLFGTEMAGGFPDGFRYATDVVSRDEEAALVEFIRGLPLQPFQFHGYTGKRRVASFGWSYDHAATVCTVLWERVEQSPLVAAIRPAQLAGVRHAKKCGSRNSDTGGA